MKALLKSIVCIMLLFFFFASTSVASPVRWTFEDGAHFLDGSDYFNGYFVFDAESGLFTDFYIQTYDGWDLDGATYSFNDAADTATYFVDAANTDEVTFYDHENSQSLILRIREDQPFPHSTDEHVDTSWVGSREYNVDFSRDIMVGFLIGSPSPELIDPPIPEPYLWAIEEFGKVLQINPHTGGIEAEFDVGYPILGFWEGLTWGRWLPLGYRQLGPHLEDQPYYR